MFLGSTESPSGSDHVGIITSRIQAGSFFGYYKNPLDTIVSCITLTRHAINTGPCSTFSILKFSMKSAYCLRTILTSIGKTPGQTIDDCSILTPTLSQIHGCKCSVGSCYRYFPLLGRIGRPGTSKMKLFKELDATWLVLSIAGIVVSLWSVTFKGLWALAVSTFGLLLGSYGYGDGIRT